MGRGRERWGLAGCFPPEFFVFQSPTAPEREGAGPGGVKPSSAQTVLHGNRSSITLQRSAGASTSSRPRPTEPGTVHVRDSKNVEGPRLAFAPAAWDNFVLYAVEG